MLRHKSLVLAGLLWTASHSPAAALPSNIVDGGAATHDTLTNLDWLDLTTTKGLSLPEVTTQFLSEGWQIASQIDVETFLGDAGVPNVFPSFDTPPDPEFLELQALLGLTGTSSDVENSYGWTSDFLLPGFRLVLLLTHDIPNDTSGYSGGFFGDPVTTGNLSFGWWLARPHAVSEPVPEPSSIALLLGGGAIMLAVRRKGKRAD